MEMRRQHAGEEALTLSRRNTQSHPVSVGNSETIPTDLIIEILLRLPGKSVARCRSVSKSWASILRREDFTELFITRSRARLQILLSCVQNSETLLFSIPQVQKPNVIAANYIMRLPFRDHYKNIGSLRGLVCFTQIGKHQKSKPVICNPSTGQFLTLPHVKNKSVLVNSFFGFDPIDKQFKILSMTSQTLRNCEDYQVLTLGTKKKMSWRMIECCISHSSVQKNGICINGVIYYVAGVSGPPRTFSIICFDVRSEKFKVLNKANDMVLRSLTTLVNYKGTLGVLLSEACTAIPGKTNCFEMWVLVDADKHEWSKHISISLPPLWRNIIDEARLEFVGVTGTGEIVLSPRHSLYLSKPYCLHVYYYNIESNTVRRVEIQVMNAFRQCKIHISLNHVEDVKLLQYI